MPPNEPKNILIVDDDADLRDVLKQVLEDEGHVVAVARNGVEALQYLRNAVKPQLILLDLMMPTMDGWQFRTEQLKDSGLAEIPVVVLSATNQLSQRAEPLHARATLNKPISIDELLAAVSRFSR
ncbi:MAG: response regulator transcription factor [Myxococcales bacterium]